MSDSEMRALLREVMRDVDEERRLAGEPRPRRLAGTAMAAAFLASAALGLAGCPKPQPQEPRPTPTTRETPDAGAAQTAPRTASPPAMRADPGPVAEYAVPEVVPDPPRETKARKAPPPHLRQPEPQPLYGVP